MQAANWSGPLRVNGGGASVHASITNSQRGANGHPGGGVRMSGGSPGSVAKVCSRSDLSVILERISAAVYGWVGARRTVLIGPVSSTRPA